MNTEQSSKVHTRNYSSAEADHHATAIIAADHRLGAQGSLSTPSSPCGDPVLEGKDSLPSSDMFSMGSDTEDDIMSATSSGKLREGI